MPYAPGVSYDTQPLMLGLTNMAQGLVAGITAKRKKEEENQKQREALGFIRKVAPQINPELGGLDDKTLMEGVKSVGADNVINLAQSITEAGQRKQAAALQRQQIEEAIAARRAELARIGTNRDALVRAAGPIDPTQQDDPARAYIRAGGDDPQQMNELNAMATRLAKGGRPGPQLMDLGGNVRGVWDGNNFSRVPDPKESTQTVEVGDETYTVGPGNKYFDKTGKPVEFKGDKPIDPITGQMLLTAYQGTIAQIQNHKPGWFEGGEKSASRLAALQEKANFQADQLGFQRPFPQAGTAPEKPEQAPAVKKGTRVRQGGVTYEFDGTNYNPVK